MLNAIIQQIVFLTFKLISKSLCLPNKKTSVFLTIIRLYTPILN